MSICTIRSPFGVADQISAPATRPRRAGAHLRALPAPATAAMLDAPGARDDVMPSAESRILRRWSVAELIAAATWSQETTWSQEAT